MQYPFGLIGILPYEARLFAFSWAASLQSSGQQWAGISKRHTTHMVSDNLLPLTLID